MIPNPYFMQNPSFMQNPNYSQTQIQQNPIISVRNEEEARNYPIAHGNSVTFKDENSPYIYTKSMGFSQLDKPIFEKYRLIKEEPSFEEPKKECGCDGLKDQLGDIQSQLVSIWDEINNLKDRKRGRNNEYTANVKSVQTKSDGDVIPTI